MSQEEERFYDHCGNGNLDEVKKALATESRGHLVTWKNSDDYNATALHTASASGHAAVAEVLLAAGADIEARDKDQRTALHWATIYGHAAVAEVLVAAGADINARDEDQRTPLHRAASNGHAAVAEVLVAAGADINARNVNHGTPLHEAAHKGHAAVAEVLLAAGADINARDNMQSTALHLAALNGHAAVAEVLLGAGPDIEAKSGPDYSQRTALQLAATSGHAAVAEVLLAAGADVNARTEYQYTPLHWAAMYGRAAVAELLVAQRAEVNARDFKQGTPLHLAASEGHAAMVEVLLDAGAAVDAVTKLQETPLDLAKNRGNSGVVRILEQALARDQRRRAEVFDCLKACKLEEYYEPLLKIGVSEKEELKLLKQEMLVNNVGMKLIQAAKFLDFIKRANENNVDEEKKSNQDEEKKSNQDMISIKDPMYEEIPDRVTKDIANRRQSQLQAYVEDANNYFPQVVFSYATGRRTNSDEDGCGPGLIVMADIATFFHENGIPCFTGLHVCPGENWEIFFTKIGFPVGNCRVFIALLSKAYFASKVCLREFAHANDADVTIIPVVIEDALPRKEDQWPDIGKGSRHLVERVKVQKRISELNYFPARGTLQSESDSLIELFNTVKRILQGAQTM